MIYALEMFFDPETEIIINGYLDELKDAGISKYLLDVVSRPHITIGVFNDIDVADCGKRLAGFCKDKEILNLTLSSIGIFTNPKPCVFLAPVVDRKMLDMHDGLQELFSDLDASGYEFYNKDTWVPHCAIDISQDISKISSSADWLMSRFKPFCCKMTGIGWVEISEPVRYLFYFDLYGQK
ncbi:MAG: 2'-5' RNA ligase family protein [Saccharofermentanales bacterium]